MSLLDRGTGAIGERQDLHSIFQVAIRSLEEHLPIDFDCVCLYATWQAFEIACAGVQEPRTLALELALMERMRIGIDENGAHHCVAWPAAGAFSTKTSESNWVLRVGA